MNLYLIGYRCTGKTTVGRQLAGHLGYAFIDTDSVIVDHTGSAISETVRKKGWRFFREQEKRIVRQTCKANRTVVATGGGVVMDRENIEAMRDSGVIIWLKASFQTIKKRMVMDKNSKNFRPGLTVNSPIDEVEQVLIERTPMYRNAANLTVETDHQTVASVVSEIADRLEKM